MFFWFFYFYKDNFYSLLSLLVHPIFFELIH
jgi:hypothetical protein